jgi:hypothetical protein
MPLFFEGFMEFKGGGGSYYFFKEGDIKTILQGGGGLLSDPPPSLLYPTPPLRERIRSSDVRGTGFFNL